jgi:hypothetical protein
MYGACRQAGQLRPNRKCERDPPEIPFNCDRHHDAIRLESQYLPYGWGQPDSKASMPGLWQGNGSHADCAASPGYRELRTYGCIECGVWVTEGRAPRDEREDSFILRE